MTNLVNTDSSDPKINQIDEALNRYYILHKERDYLNCEGIGKFKAFCCEQGFDDESVEAELESDPTDCQLFDFDQDGLFPFAELDENKELIAHKILRFCFYDIDAYKDNVLLPSPLKITYSDWNISDDEISDIIKMYKPQLNTIWDLKFKEDKDLLTALAVGYRLNVPYLQFLTDSFLRDRTKDQKINDVKDWVIHNKHIKILQKYNKHLSAQHAINSFFVRMCPKLVLSPLQKIQDSLSRISEIILALIQFVYNIANNKMTTTCPFQADCCIIFEKIISAEKIENIHSKLHIIKNKPLSTMISWLKNHKKWRKFESHFEEFEIAVNDIFPDNHDEFDIDSLLTELEEEDESEIIIAIKENEQCQQIYNKTFIEELKKLIKTYQHELKVEIDKNNNDIEDDEKYDIQSNEYFDCIGDIKHRLKTENLLYLDRVISNTTLGIPNISGLNTNIGSTTTSRLPHDFNDFVKTKISTKYKNKIRAEYPRNKRFITVIDRRHKNAERPYLSEADEIIFFEPPSNCNTIPNGHVPEWFFESSRNCIIPNCGYNNGKNRDDIDENELPQNDPQSKIRLSKQTITSTSPCKHALMSFSFHIQSIDEIKCYMYLNGQIHRFFADDITQVLPEFFDENYENNKVFATSQAAQNVIEYIRPKLRDLKFESFLKEYSIYT